MLDGIKILVVEDNLLNHKIVNFVLLRQRAIVKMAMNGKEAIALLKNTSFDMVLMDLQMPVMDGYDAIKYIRNEMKNSVPIIALTAGLFIDEVNECLSIGANACVSKPIDPKGICEQIANMVKEHKNLSDKIAV